MPLDLQEVAAYHHQPSHSINKGFTVLTAVHVANAFQYERHPDSDDAAVSKIDEAYLTEIGLLDRVSFWRDGKKPDAKKRATASKAEAKSKVEAQAPAQPQARPSLEVKTLPTPPAPPKRTPAPVPASAMKSVSFLTRKQWAFAGVGAAFAVLLLAWLVTSSLTKSDSDKLDSASQPVVARAREAAPADQTATVAPPANPDKSKTSPLTNAAPVAKAVPQELTFADLKLQGIFYSAKHPTAILSGKMVQPNDHLAGALVVSIGPSSVTLEHQNQRTVLVLK